MQPLIRRFSNAVEIAFRPDKQLAIARSRGCTERAEIAIKRRVVRENLKLVARLDDVALAIASEQNDVATYSDRRRVIGIRKTASWSAEARQSLLVEVFACRKACRKEDSAGSPVKVVAENQRSADT